MGGKLSDSTSFEEYVTLQLRHTHAQCLIIIVSWLTTTTLISFNLLNYNLAHNTFAVQMTQCCNFAYSAHLLLIVLAL